MKRHTATFLIPALVALIVFFYPQHFSRSGVLAGQRRPARRVARPQPASTRIDYSKFSHATLKHKGECNTCHKIPTGNWKKVREFPDVADFPDHDACVSCHRPQFFKSAKPPICAVCHSKVSPRDDVRFTFRKPAARRQFMIEFPHDKHQDVIAKLFRRFPVEEKPRFVRASFTSSTSNADDKAQHFNNCEVCHGPRNAPSAAPASGWIDGFVPDNLTLRAVPVSHSSCFSCHWKSEQPVNDNCAGCHKLTASLAMPTGADLPKRFSMKFRHGRADHILECTVCHINITKAATLRGLKPDVPITSCSGCHNKDGLRQDLNKELAAIDKARDFVCAYCHTSDVGRRDPPASHYLSAGRPALKRSDVK